MPESLDLGASHPDLRRNAWPYDAVVRHMVDVVIQRRGAAASLWRMVDPAGVEWVTSSDSPNGQAQTTDPPELSDGGLGIGGAAGIKAALPAQQHLADRDAVEPDQADQRGSYGGAGPPGHSDQNGPQSLVTPSLRSSAASSAATSAVRAVRMPGRESSTACVPGRTVGSIIFQASRITRRALFRTTAPPTDRPAMNPVLVPACAGRAWTASSSPTARLPLWSTRRNCAPPRSFAGALRATGMGQGRTGGQRTRQPQAERLARAFLRRRAKIARPARVFMRALKP